MQSADVPMHSFQEPFIEREADADAVSWTEGVIPKAFDPVCTRGLGDTNGLCYRVSVQDEGAQFDLELVRRAASGDRAAARAVVVRLAPIVQRSVSRALRSRHLHTRQELEDFVQEAFVALFAQGGRELLRWDPARGMQLEGFVGLVTQRLVVARLRPRRLEALELRAGAANADAPALLSSADEVFAAREDLQMLSERLRVALSPLALDMFQRLFVFEQTVEVICQECGMTADAVYQWRKRLRDTLQHVRDELALPLAGGSRRGGE